MSELNYYRLISTTVVFIKDDSEGSRNINVLSVSPDDFVTQLDMTNAQMGAQVRFNQLFDDTANCKVVDVFIIGISKLGCMTDDQFRAGMPQLQADTDTAAND